MTYRRPHFVREESWRYKRVKDAWRSPRGKTSRVRRSKEGWPAVVKIGYARPKSARGRHPSGLVEVMVWRPKDLEGLDPKTQAARIAHTVGENKRIMIIDQAKKASIRILNPGVKEKEEEAPVITPETAEPTEPEVEVTPETPAVPAEESAKTEPELETSEPEEKKAPAKKRKKSKTTKKKSDKK